MRILAWGTYDLGKPRVRLMLRALRTAGIELGECHVDVWGGTDDKSQLKGLATRLRLFGRFLRAYPRLIWRLLRRRRPDVLYVGYLGQFDVLVLWPFARLLHIPIAWDAFLSLHNTVVEDRRMVGPKHPLGLLLYALEWLATRAADLVILDTRAHADYFVEKFGIDAEKTGAVFVGAEGESFAPREAPRDPEQPFTVLFYGQFIPLHGIPTIIEAARLLERENIRWLLVGTGQEESVIAGMLEEHPLPRLEWTRWVDYAELSEWINRADVCLGIFDGGEKASRVIPNKVFQVLSAGRPLITRDSPAVCELIAPPQPGVLLVPPVDAAALAEAVLRMRGSQMHGEPLHRALGERFSTATNGERLLNMLRPLVPGAPGP